MKKALLAVMAIALVIGFAGCDIFGGAKSPYCPLAEGNKWDYDVTMQTTVDDSVTLDSTWTTSSEVIGETETTGDEPIKVWEVKTGDVSSYVNVDKDWVYFYDDLANTEEWYKFPNEPIIGDKWDITTITEINDTTSDTSTTSYEVVADGEEANGYTGCLKVQSTPESKVTDLFDTYESFLYWAKDVGNVLGTTKIVKKTVVLEDTITATTETESKLNTFTEGS